MSHSRTDIDEARFWAKVMKMDTCWLWTGGSNAGGYGHFSVNRKSMMAHRISFELHHGRWPTGFVLHHCDTPACVNPDHLYEGTSQDNVDDMMLRRRDALRGERNYACKMSDADVMAARFLYFTEIMNLKELCRFYGVSSDGSLASVLKGKKRRKYSNVEREGTVNRVTLRC